VVGTLLFVHGTGVRREGYEAKMKAIRSGVANEPRLQGLTVEGCPWGETLGVSNDRIADTLPPEDETRALEAPLSEVELAEATWAILAIDPLFELRVAAARGDANTTAIGTLPADQNAIAMLLNVDPTSLPLADTDGSAEDISTALDSVSRSEGARGLSPGALRISETGG
jgi:hypothetical protein